MEGAADIIIRAGRMAVVLAERARHQPGLGG